MLRVNYLFTYFKRDKSSSLPKVQKKSFDLSYQTSRLNLFNEVILTDDSFLRIGNFICCDRADLECEVAESNEGLLKKLGTVVLEG